MSDRSTGKEVKAVMPTYISFLMGRLTEIWQAWDSGDPEFALRKSCRLVLFLPRDLKKKMREDVQLISKEMNWAYNLNSADFFTTNLIRNRQGRMTAARRLPPFIDKITDLLDERGFYLEKVKEYRIGRFRPRA